jgi:hypothetical protein
MVLRMNRRCFRGFSLPLERRIAISYVSSGNHTCFRRFIRSNSLVIVYFVIATMVQVIFADQSQICVAFECRHMVLAIGILNWIWVVTFVDVES